MEFNIIELTDTEGGTHLINRRNIEHINFIELDDGLQKMLVRTISGNLERIIIYPEDAHSIREKIKYGQVSL